MKLVRARGLVNRSRRQDQGAAAVEFALVLPLLVLLIFGIVDFGRLLRSQLVVTEAAREAARAVALVDAETGEDRAQQITEGIDADHSLTNIVIVECDGSDPTADATVTVTYSFSFITPVFLALGFGGADGQLDVSSTSVMPCLQ